MKYSTQPPTQVEWGVVASPIGKLAVGITDKGEICRIAFMSQQKIDDIVTAWEKQWPHTLFKRKAGRVGFVQQPVLLVGTYFQYQVWRAMTKIPVGRTATYGDLARHIGNPKAVRAVGSACGANPVPYLVPCHRVVGGKGIGGFSSGLDIKKKLLKLEGVQI